MEEIAENVIEGVEFERSGDCGWREIGKTRRLFSVKFSDIFRFLIVVGALISPRAFRRGWRGSG